MWSHKEVKFSMIIGLLSTLMVFCLGVLNLKEAAAEKPAAKPVVSGVDDRITVRNMKVRLPAGEGWTKRVTKIGPEGKLYAFERDLPNGNRQQIHIADYFGREGAKEYLKATKGIKDDNRLAVFTDNVTAIAASPEIRLSEWVAIPRGPQKQYGAACRERHDIREDEESKGRFMWQDWMLFCIDPISHVPIEVDYAERYPVDGAPSPAFAKEAAAFYDSIEFK
jgi:hypothetical protein